MNKNHGPSIYFANDKNVFDALHHKSVTRVALKLFLKIRGIYVSDSIDRNELSAFPESIGKQ